MLIFVFGVSYDKNLILKAFAVPKVSFVINCIQALVKATIRTQCSPFPQWRPSISDKLETLALEQREESAQIVVGKGDAAKEAICAAMYEGAFAFSDIKQVLIRAPAAAGQAGGSKEMSHRYLQGSSGRICFGVVEMLLMRHCSDERFLVPRLLEARLPSQWK